MPMGRWVRGGGRLVIALLAACAGAPLAPAPIAPAAPPVAEAAPAEPAPPPEPAPAPSGLRFFVEPPSAEVIVNGVSQGSAAAISGGGGLLRLVPDLYRIELVRPGYRTWRGEVAVGAAPETLRVTLSRP